MRWIFLLLLAGTVLAEDACHLLVAPPPVGCEKSILDVTLSAPPENMAEDQVKEDQKKGKALNQPIEIETKSENDIQRIIKNPKFKLNIPF